MNAAPGTTSAKAAHLTKRGTSLRLLSLRAPSHAPTTESAGKARIPTTTSQETSGTGTVSHRWPSVPRRERDLSRTEFDPKGLACRSIMTRAAIYLRVSTDRQSTENQRPEVEQLASARGFGVVHVYEETASAAKHRPKYDQMLKDARRGKFKVLVIWAIDRFGRSMVGNLQDVLELDRLGVTVVSVRETWLDTGSPVRSLLVAIFSWVAEQERTRLVERTKAGMLAARRRGSKIGRPRRRVDVDLARELRASGKTLRQVAAELGVGPATLHRALAGMLDPVVA